METYGALLLQFLTDWLFCPSFAVIYWFTDKRIKEKKANEAKAVHEFNEKYGIVDDHH